MEIPYILFWKVNTCSCQNLIEMRICAIYCSLIIPHFLNVWGQISLFQNTENKLAPNGVHDTRIKSQVLQATQGRYKAITALLLFITVKSRMQTWQDLLNKSTALSLMSDPILSSLSSQCYLMLIHPNLLMCHGHNLSVSARNCSGSALKALGIPAVTTQSLSVVWLPRTPPLTNRLIISLLPFLLFASLCKSVQTLSCEVPLKCSQTEWWKVIWCSRVTAGEKTHIF